MLHDSVSTSCIAIAMDDCDDDSAEGSDTQSHPHKGGLNCDLVISSGYDGRFVFHPHSSFFLFRLADAAYLLGLLHATDDPTRGKEELGSVLIPIEY